MGPDILTKSQYELLNQQIKLMMADLDESCDSKRYNQKHVQYQNCSPSQNLSAPLSGNQLQFRQTSKLIDGTPIKNNHFVKLTQEEQLKKLYQLFKNSSSSKKPQFHSEMESEEVFPTKTPSSSSIDDQDEDFSMEFKQIQRKSRLAQQKESNTRKNKKKISEQSGKLLQKKQNKKIDKPKVKAKRVRKPKKQGKKKDKISNQVFNAICDHFN